MRKIKKREVDILKDKILDLLNEFNSKIELNEDLNIIIVDRDNLDFEYLNK